MATSIRPVAMIWLSAPSSSHGQNTGVGHGTWSPETSTHHDEEDHRKGKAEQEADVGRAPGAERLGERTLHGVARDLAERGDDREGNPERGGGEHGGPGRKRRATVPTALVQVNRGAA